MSLCVKYSLDAFATRLASGGYADGHRARQAIGKMSTWTDEDRQAARELVDVRFGPSPTPKNHGRKKYRRERSVAPVRRGKRVRKSIQLEVDIIERIERYSAHIEELFGIELSKSQVIERLVKRGLAQIEMPREGAVRPLRLVKR
jgi:hypothetical protein